MILEKMENAEIQMEFEDEYGKRFSSDLEFYLNGKKAIVKSIWIMKRNENIARFEPCYVNQ